MEEYFYADVTLKFIKNTGSFYKKIRVGNRLCQPDFACINICEFHTYTEKIMEKLGFFPFHV